MLPSHLASPLAESLRKRLAPVCEPGKCVVAGSLRRHASAIAEAATSAIADAHRAALVKDIELVVYPLPALDLFGEPVHSGLMPVGGAVLAPLITWFPMLALRYPGLGFTQYPPAIGIDFWGMQALWLTLLAFLGALIATRDRYFGIAVALGGLVIFWRGAALDPTHTVLFALGGVLLLGLRRAPAISHRNIDATLAALGAFQVAYILTQLAGYDLLWAQLWGLQTL